MATVNLFSPSGILLSTVINSSYSIEGPCDYGGKSMLWTKHTNRMRLVEMTPNSLDLSRNVTVSSQLYGVALQKDFKTNRDPSKFSMQKAYVLSY